MNQINSNNKNDENINNLIDEIGNLDINNKTSNQSSTDSNTESSKKNKENDKVKEKIKEGEIQNIKNKGTGAGGSNTNKNGLLYEKLTDLNDRCIVVETLQNAQKIKFDNSKKIFIKTQQFEFLKYMKDKINNEISPAHGCKKPDECYIDEELKNIFIIEKKFQQVHGSVCEKIQTPHFKLWQYRRKFPDYNIIYIYCLSEWFKKNCKSELEYLNFIKCPYFLGNSKTYKDDIINFIINYK